MDSSKRNALWDCLESNPVGLSAISVYVPRGYVDLAGLAETRNAQRQANDKRDFFRSLDYIGQREFRMAEVWEDSVTMAAESVRSLALANDVSLGSVTKLICGTETALDFSKPVSSYVQGLVGVNGDRIGPGCSVYEVKHACAGSAYALISSASEILVESAAGIPSRAIVSAVDISRYEPGTTAELTNGAGAVSMLVERDPKLVRLDPAVVGLHSLCVDDFFRPLTSIYAHARGRLSIQCYKDAIVGAVRSYGNRSRLAGRLNGTGIAEILSSFDYMILHAPFAAMPTVAAHHLFTEGAGLSSDEASRQVRRMRIFDSVTATSLVGNILTASLPLCLADLLEHEAERIGAEIEGKRILFCAYGSGSTMAVFGGTVVPGALEAIGRIRLRESIEPKRKLSVAEYEDRLTLDRWNSKPIEVALARHLGETPPGAYRIAGIRPDGYRLYEAEREA